MPHPAMLRWGTMVTSRAKPGFETDQRRGRAMTNQYEWIDSHDNPRTEYGSGDMLIGWIIYAAAVVTLIV